jgi:Cu(I)/Ag(I) efflux system membrane fusion protein
MKIKSTFFPLLFSAAVFAFLSGCSGNKKEEETSHKDHDVKKEEASDAESREPTGPQFVAPQEFQEQLLNVFRAYIDLKEALVSSDLEKAKSEAILTRQAVGKVDMKLLSGAAHNDWMAYLMPINNSLKDIATSSDLESLRKEFSTLSDNLYKSIKAFGLGGTEAFYEFCPMAFDNAGGYWLSDNSQIRNPYFGDKMLACGEVRERLR